MADITLNDPRTIKAWCMYDWANSVYNLVITTTFFPIYFAGITSAAYGEGRVPFLGRYFKSSALYDYTPWLLLTWPLPAYCLCFRPLPMRAEVRKGLCNFFVISAGLLALPCFGSKVLCRV